MRWKFAWVSLSIAATLAAFAFFWHTEAEVEQQMKKTLVGKASAWSVHAEGKLQELPLKVDLVYRDSVGSVLRLAYPPLKLLNNQWIELEKSPASHPLMYAVLSEKLSAVEREGVRFSRYAFTLPQVVVQPFLLRSAQGELWFAGDDEVTSWSRAGRRLIWGTPLHEVTPRYAVLRLTMEDSQEAELALRFNDDLLTPEALVTARPLEAVLAQLEEVQKARNGKPKKIPSLLSGTAEVSAFSSDFDHDGLTDALELFYGTDPANPDTDDDTFLDGIEVKQGYNPREVSPLK